jgi:hypothetical protein
MSWLFGQYCDGFGEGAILYVDTGVSEKYAASILGEPSSDFDLNTSSPDPEYKEKHKKFSSC